MNTEEKATLYELLFGIVLFSAASLLVNLFISRRLVYSLGVLLGTAIAVFMLFHMYSVLKRALRYDKDTAAKKVRVAALLRMAVMVAGVMLAVLLPEVFSFVGVLLGVLTLKFAAYLQPLTHKFFNKILSKGR